MADVAQLVRASVCGTEGRGFKSHHSPHVYHLIPIDPEAEAEFVEYLQPE
jgi:hypothetical protein